MGLLLGKYGAFQHHSLDGINFQNGNPGNKLSGHHLSVGHPSVCPQGMPCQVLWSGMLGWAVVGSDSSKCINSACYALLQPFTQKALSCDHYA